MSADIRAGRMMEGGAEAVNAAGSDARDYLPCGIGRAAARQAPDDYPAGADVIIS
jgi:hypothetical protein